MQKKENLNELALFAGAGGGILGGKLLGWRTVCAVEWEPYPASVLVARQNEGLLPPFPIWDDVQTFDGKPWRGIVDVVSGGFPCQDISAAGKGAGIDGERSGMWGHMARIIGEVRPRYVFVENSPMLVTRGLERVLGDLTALGYDTKWTVMGAADVGANHKRDRIWIVGKVSNPMCGRSQKQTDKQILESKRGSQLHPSQPGNTSEMADTSELFSNGGNDNSRISLGREAQSESGNDCGSKNVAHSRLQRGKARTSDSQGGQEGKPAIIDNSGYNLAHTENGGDVWRQWQLGFAQQEHNSGGGSTNGRREWWEAEPNVGRVANGVAARVDRLKAIGNGQVPLCAATAWRMLR
jgi:DNA (cytosine-5)-methyltransferase 1